MPVMVGRHPEPVNAGETFGYVPLSVGLVVIGALFYWVPLLRSN